MSLSSVLRSVTAGAFLALVPTIAVASPAFAAPAAQTPITVDVTKSNVAPLVDAGFAAQIDGAWYVDGATVAAAAAALGTVNSSQTGYDRDLFNHWADPDGNGRDARNDMLQRDLTNVVLRDGDVCIVERGTLNDTYTGDTIPFVRGTATSGAVQIDHIIPLAAAWTGGASEWDADKREAFANDPANLAAVEGRANSAKGMRLASEWMPSNTAFHCTYLAQLTSVLTTYDLAVTPIDQDAIINGGTVNGVDFAGVASCALPAGASVEPTAAPTAAPVETADVTPTASASGAPTEAPAADSPAPSKSPAASAVDGTDQASTELATTGDNGLVWTFGLGAVALVVAAAAFLQHRLRKRA